VKTQEEAEMKRTWPIIGVNDVAASCTWYLSLFGQPQRPPAHDDFTLIEDDDGTILLGLHEWGGHGEGPPLQSPGDGQPGNGALFFIRVDDFDESLERARELVSRFETYPEVFESGPGTNAFTVRDPDGYYVTVNAMGHERR
jgi:catechol 2,3-dioxygenase-like lactoylglutathione lyase family enzyme